MGNTLLTEFIENDTGNYHRNTIMAPEWRRDFIIKVDDNFVQNFDGHRKNEERK